MTNISDEQIAKFFLHGIIDRFEGEMAIVRMEDGQELRVPRLRFPDGAREGEGIKMRIFSDADYGAEKENIAKNIISEIIQANA